MCKFHSIDWWSPGGPGICADLIILPSMIPIYFLPNLTVYSTCTFLNYVTPYQHNPMHINSKASLIKFHGTYYNMHEKDILGHITLCMGKKIRIFLCAAGFGHFKSSVSRLSVIVGDVMDHLVWCKSTAVTDWLWGCRCWVLSYQQQVGKF